MIENIILDRDGVINVDSKDYIKSAAEFIPIDGSIEAIANAYKNGIKIFVATNQSGVGRGLFDLKTLEQIFAKLTLLVIKAGGALSDIIYCPHLPDANCECRKPKPGMLFELQKKHKLDFNKSIFIGDSIRDIDAAIAADVEPVLVKTGNGDKTLSKLKSDTKIKVFPNLFHAVEHFINAK